MSGYNHSEWVGMLRFRQGFGQGRVEGHAEGRAEGLVEGRAEGRAETLAEVAKNLLSIGTPIESIMKVTGMTEDEIKNLA